jgi:hypothetical protein
MSTYRAVLFGLGLLAGGIAFGTQLNVLTVVLPGMRKEEGEVGVRLHRNMLDHAAHTLTVIPAVNLMATAAALLLLHGGFDNAAQAAALVAVLLGVVGITITTVGYQVPTNTRIREGKVAAADYAAALDRWQRVHLWRTVSGALAFGGMILAAVL